MEHSGGLKRVLALVALSLAAPVTAQDDNPVHFSLASSRTFAPGEKAVIQLWATGLRSLEMRCYRIKDPVAFLEKLEEPHSSGQRGGPIVAQRPPITAWRSWKTRLRDGTRRLVRAQFDDAGRDRLRAMSYRQPAAGAPDLKPSSRTEYATIPLLNPDQLVARWTQPFAPANRWESVQAEVPVRGKGLYLVEATDGKMFAYTVVFVSDLALITKSSSGKVWAQVMRRDNGAPQAGVELTVVGGEPRRRLVESKTDTSGVWHGEADAARASLILARSGDDFAATTVYTREDSSERWQAMSYTDRPVYRPGHAVNYRAIVRLRGDSGYRLPTSEISIEINDPDGNTVHRDRRKPSATGTVHGSFRISDSAPLGYWDIQLREDGEVFHSSGFQVEEYRKPEYLVRVTPAQRRVIQGGVVEAQIEARYFFGEPVANARLTYVAHRSRYWAPFFHDPGDRDESGGAEEDSPYADREQVLEEQGKLDAEGRLSIRIPTQQADHDLIYRIEARVTDEAGREIAGAGFAVATVGDFVLGVEPDKYVYAPGDQAEFTVEARDYDSKPVPGKAVEVRLERHESSNSLVATQSATTGDDGKARVRMRIQSGSYIARAVAKTSSGRDVQARAWVWASGGFDWGGRGAQQVQIVPDRKSYRPGDKAKVLIVAGKPGTHLWITVEGRGVSRSEQVLAKEASVTFEIDVQAAHVPNFFVNAVAVREGKLVQGSKLIRVPPDEHRLAVTLRPSKPEFKPGEPATYTLEAKDWRGNPARGEFSVGVVDEAIYSIQPDPISDLIPHFYGRQWNRVQTDSSLSYYFHGSAGTRRLQLARVRPFRPRAQLKPDSLEQPKVRKAFPDTAFWIANVITDASGRAQVRFDFPDALTTWRTTARGVTADTKVGAAVDKVVVRKNLLIRLSTPRFFRQGDEMTMAALVQNFLPDAKRVRLSLEAKGLELLDPATSEIDVPSRGTASVNYRVRVPGSSEAVLLAKALTDEESDAIELTLPVQPFGIRLANAHGGTLSAGQSAEVESAPPPGADVSSQVLEISVSPSVAGPLFEALDYLTSFPYGCVEQTMSSFLPNVIVSQAVRSLGAKAAVSDAQLPGKIRAGLARLYDFQHDDGGWGWWKEDESHPFMTPYVVAGLGQAEEAGYRVERERLRRGADWLRANLAAPGMKPDLKAYAAYALALSRQPEQALVNALYADRHQLSPYGVALLGLALDLKDPRVAPLASHLEALAKTTDLEAWWPALRDEMLDIAADATPEATAYAVKFLSRAKPDSALTQKAALWLVNHRNQGYYWNSTKQTAMVIYGLTDFVARSGELQPDVTARVSVGGREVVAKRFTPADAFTPVSVRVPADRLGPRNKVRVESTGKGRVYWSARLSYFTEKPPQDRMDTALSINREYHRVVPYRQGETIRHRLEPLEGEVKQGDVIAVRLAVSSKGTGSRYLLIEDPIPAGTESVGRDDLYDFDSKPPWWRFVYTRRELRDDRTAFFQTHALGDSDYVYMLKVVNPGAFRVSPARVEPMYSPGQFAMTGAAKLAAVAREAAQ